MKAAIKEEIEGKRPPCFRPGETVYRGVDRRGNPVEMTFINYVYVSSVGKMAMVEYRKPRKLVKTIEICFIQELKRKDGYD